MKKAGILFVLMILLMVNVILAGELQVTQEHPFLVDDEWIPASALNVGDELVNINGEKIKIISIKDVSSPTEVYNLDSFETDDFVVGVDNVVVHNSEQPIVYPEQCPNLGDGKLCLDTKCELKLCGGKPAEGWEYEGPQCTPAEVLKYPQMDKKTRDLYQDKILGLRDGENKPYLDALRDYKKAKTGEIKEKLKEYESDLSQSLYSYEPTKEEAIRVLREKFPDKSDAELESGYNAYEKYKTAVDEYIEGNVGLAYYFWKKFDGNMLLKDKVETLDGKKIPEGVIIAGQGLRDAWESYDLSYGTQYSTHAGYQAQKEIISSRWKKLLGVSGQSSKNYKYYKAIGDFSNRNGRLPVSREELIEDFKSDFYKRFKKDPTPEEIEDALPEIVERGMEGMICRYKQITEKDQSIDKPYEDGENKDWYDPKSPNPQEEAVCNERKTDLNSVLDSDQFSDRQRLILQLRARGYSLEETGIILGLRESGYSDEEITFAMNKYAENLEKYPLKDFKNQNDANNFRIGKAIEALKEEYGGKPEVFTKENIRQQELNANALLRTRAIWGKINEAVKFEIELGSKSQLIKRGGGAYSDPKEVLGLYYGYAEPKLDKKGNTVGIEYLTNPGRRYSFKEIQDILSKIKTYEKGSEYNVPEKSVRDGYKKGIDTLNDEYDFGLYLPTETDEFSDLHFPKSVGGKRPEPNWKNSIENDPSLCKPLPEKVYEPTIAEEPKPVDLTLLETKDIPVSPDVTPDIKLDSKFDKARELLKGKYPGENGKKTTWLHSRENGEGYYDSDVAIFEEVDAFGNPTGRKKAVILEGNGKKMKEVPGDAIIYDPGRRALVTERENKLYTAYPDRWYEGNYNWNQKMVGKQSPIYFNPKTRRAFEPNADKTDMLSLDVKTYDDYKNVALIERGYELIAYEGGSGAKGRVYSGRNVEEVGKAFYDSEKGTLTINVAGDIKGEPILTNPIKPFFTAELTGELSGRKLVVIEDSTVNSGKLTVYIQGDYKPTLLESAVRSGRILNIVYDPETGRVLQFVRGDNNPLPDRYYLYDTTVSESGVEFTDYRGLNKILNPDTGYAE